uniref:SH3 domain-binding glutamic acid-rich n=1 Tax=Melanaphis sacchari TaxID=742174 RepID=A0A2H8TK80_9HEMI
MVVKVYMSGISGNKEVKKRQQRVTMILDSKSISYDLIDITEPGKEDEKAYMQNNSKTKDGSKNALPPQIFNDDVYCGDYDDFDTANELDELDKFFDISTKSPPKELNGSTTVENVKNESTNELDELDKFFDISTKSPPKELNGSTTVENVKNESTNEVNDSNDGTN